MLLTGTTFKLPFQSAEAGFAQFLSANQLISRLQLRKDLMMMSGKDPNASANRSLATLALYQKSFNVHSNIPFTTVIRNCRTCMSNLYHSDLYHLPWLQQCPIHPEQTLTSHCPGCHRAWFATTSCECEICGLVRPVSAVLKARQTFRPDWTIFRKIKSMLRWYSRCHTLIRMTVNGLNASAICSNAIFPSIVSHQYPKFRPFFVSLGTQLYSCEEHIFAIERVSTTAPDWTVNFLHYHKGEVQIAIDNIQNRIQTYLYKSHHCTCQSASIAHRNEVECPACDALHLWKNLVNSRHRQRLSANRFSWCYQICFGNSGPRPPASSSVLYRDGHHHQTRFLTIPIAAQMLLYEFELWLQFFKLYAATSYFISEMPKPLHDRKPIPPLADPDLSVLDAIGLFEQTGKLLIIAPTWLASSNPIPLINFFGGLA